MQCTDDSDSSVSESPLKTYTCSYHLSLPFSALPCSPPLSTSSVPSYLWSDMPHTSHYPSYLIQVVTTPPTSLSPTVDTHNSAYKATLKGLSSNESPASSTCIAAGEIQYTDMLSMNSADLCAVKLNLNPHSDLVASLYDDSNLLEPSLSIALVLNKRQYSDTMTLIPPSVQHAMFVPPYAERAYTFPLTKKVKLQGRNDIINVLEQLYVSIYGTLVAEQLQTLYSLERLSDHNRLKLNWSKELGIELGQRERASAGHISRHVRGTDSSVGTAPVTTGNAYCWRRERQTGTGCLEGLYGHTSRSDADFVSTMTAVEEFQQAYNETVACIDQSQVELQEVARYYSHINHISTSSTASTSTATTGNHTDIVVLPKLTQPPLIATACGGYHLRRSSDKHSILGQYCANNLNLHITYYSPSPSSSSVSHLTTAPISSSSSYTHSSTPNPDAHTNNSTITNSNSNTSANTDNNTTAPPHISDKYTQTHILPTITVGAFTAQRLSYKNGGLYRYFSGLTEKETLFFIQQIQHTTHNLDTFLLLLRKFPTVGSEFLPPGATMNDINTNKIVRLYIWRTKYELCRRIDMCTSQALGYALTYIRLLIHLAYLDVPNYRLIVIRSLKIGFLVSNISYLSSYGAEWGMIEDMYIACLWLESVNIRFVSPPSTTVTTAPTTAAPPSALSTTTAAATDSIASSIHISETLGEQHSKGEKSETKHEEEGSVYEKAGLGAVPIQSKETEFNQACTIHRDPVRIHLYYSYTDNIVHYIACILNCYHCVIRMHYRIPVG